MSVTVMSELNNHSLFDMLIYRCEAAVDETSDR